MKSKVTELKAFGDLDKYGNKMHSIKFEDGTEGLYLGNPEKPAFTVGQEGEYEIEVKQGKKGDYNRIRRPKKDFTQTKEMSYTEVLQYCRKNALRACALSKQENRSEYAKFILGSVRSSIPMWGEEHRNLDNRRDALLSACESGEKDVLTKAKEHYEYIVGN